MSDCEYFICIPFFIILMHSNGKPHLIYHLLKTCNEIFNLQATNIILQCIGFIGLETWIFPIGNRWMHFKLIENISVRYMKETAKSSEFESNIIIMNILLSS